MATGRHSMQVWFTRDSDCRHKTDMDRSWKRLKTRMREVRENRKIAGNQPSISLTAASPANLLLVSIQRTLVSIGYFQLSVSFNWILSTLNKFHIDTFHSIKIPSWRTPSAVGSKVDDHDHEILPKEHAPKRNGRNPLTINLSFLRNTFHTLSLSVGSVDGS